MKIIRNKSNNNNNNNKMLTYSKNYIKKIIADNNSQRHCRSLIPYCDLRIVYNDISHNKIHKQLPGGVL